MEKNNHINKNNLIIQERLIQMGFDITMINKIFFYFDIENENQVIDYLMIIDDKWNHPFIQKEKDDNSINDNNNFVPENMINNFIKVGSQKLLKNKLVTEKEICDICGDSREKHIESEINNNNNIIMNKDIKNNNKINELNINNDNSNEDVPLFVNKGNSNEINSESEINTNKNENSINNNIINNNNINNNNIINNNENINDEIDTNCPICMGDFEEPIILEKCKHKFCKDCFHSYLMDKINRNDIKSFNCPKINCFNKNLSEELLYHYLTEGEYIKYQNFKSKNEIENDPNKIFCPICDSYAELEKDKIKENENINNNSNSNNLNSITHFDSNNSNYIKTKLYCIKNNHEFCSCGRLIHEGNCFRDEKEFKSYLSKEKIKKCPKCGFLIKKDKGCNHMTCGNPNCKFEFCWICMNESLPNHFEEGPCAGLQFVNEDSFMFKLKENHIYIYKFLICLSWVWYVNVFLAFIFIPFVLSMFCSYTILYNENFEFFNTYKVSKRVKKLLNFFQFIIASCMGISYCFFQYGIIILILPLVAILLTIFFICLIFYFFAGCCSVIKEQISNHA
jgi:hypothetical protein